MNMDKLREVLDHWGRIGVKGPVYEAARAVLDSEEVWWCDFHKAAGVPGLDCWGAGINGQDSCSMVRRRLLP